MNVNMEGEVIVEIGASTIVKFEVCRKSLTNLSFFGGGGFGGSLQKRKGVLAVVHDGE